MVQITIFISKSNYFSYCLLLTFIQDSRNSDVSLYVKKEKRKSKKNWNVGRDLPKMFVIRYKSLSFQLSLSKKLLKMI